MLYINHRNVIFVLVLFFSLVSIQACSHDSNDTENRDEVKNDVSEEVVDEQENVPEDKNERDDVDLSE
ncbi:hypothetical protein [Ornithinibacillus sp. JPR2-1]|uniref:hypothetical protein n=1 Tax=Ornithinibacillus sp. JPR2-1 TaxID=2094019 RepID=UPI0031CF31ED